MNKVFVLCGLCLCIFFVCLSLLPLSLMAVEKIPTPTFADVPPLDDQHIVLQNILQKVVRVRGVDYGLLRKSFANDLDRYRQQLAHAPKTDDADVDSAYNTKMAFYINAYNALTLYEVVRFLPQDAGDAGQTWKDWSVRSVRHFWKAYTFEVAGEWLSLDDIEHKILRPMGDPRIHFAVNCASQSCPPLIKQTYTATRLNAQLNVQTKIFANSTYHLRFTNGRLEVNKILSWFAGDFKKSGGVSKFIQQYIDDGPVKEFLQAGGKIHFFPYDWKLNVDLKDK